MLPTNYSYAKSSIFFPQTKVIVSEEWHSAGTTKQQQLMTGGDMVMDAAIIWVKVKTIKL